MNGLSPQLRYVANRAFRSFVGSDAFSVAVTLRQSSGVPSYNPATGQSVYTEIATSLSAFRAIVAKKQATEQIIAGTVRYDFDASAVATPIKIGDTVTDSDGVVWSVYEIGAPDPTQSLIRAYTRRSPA